MLLLPQARRGFDRRACTRTSEIEGRIDWSPDRGVSKAMCMHFWDMWVVAEEAVPAVRSLRLWLLCGL